MQRKKLKRLDKIVQNLNEKEHERFREVLQKEDPLGGSKGTDHVDEVSFFHFLLKNEFVSINCQHVLNTRCYIVFMLCKEQNANLGR